MSLHCVQQNNGDGLIGVPDKDDPRDISWIRILDSLLISLGPNSLQTYPTGIHLSVRAIVCPTNEIADDINTHILKMISHFKNDQHNYQDI